MITRNLKVLVDQYAVSISDENFTLLRLNLRIYQSMSFGEQVSVFGVVLAQVVREAYEKFEFERERSYRDDKL